MENVLMMNKKYLGRGLKSIDMLILAQIETCNYNGTVCCTTNQQFSEMFGESDSTIKRALNKLEELNLIHKEIIYVDGNGRATKQRILSLCDSI